MDCQTTKERISQLLDNELPAEELQPVFIHLSQCKECRTFYMQTITIRDAAQHLPNESVPDSVDRKFSVLAIRDTGPRFLDKTITVSVPSAVLSLGAAVMMVLLLYMVGDFQERNLTAQYKQTVGHYRHVTTVSVDRN